MHQVFLSHGNILYGYFHSQVTPRYHDAVRHFEDAFQIILCPGAFNLSDNERVVSHGRRCITHGSNIPGIFYKGLTDCIHSLFQGKFKTLAVSLGKRADAKINARQVKALARA